MDSYIIYCEEETLSSSDALLVIPVADASRYSTKPLKWIRYIMAAVVGCEGELIIHTEDENNHEGQTLLLNLEDVAPQHRKLCFIPGGPISFVDLDGLNHLKSSQVTTPSRAGFRDDIVERDGSCVNTGIEEQFCDACHLIPHSKGNGYIQALCLWKNITGEAEIDNINDIRNGILVDPMIHRFFDMSQFAVLPTPNFSLGMDEVLPNPTYQNPSFRFTPHFFFRRAPSDFQLHRMNQYQADFRYPVEMIDEWPKDWPPDFLWNFIYGIIIVKTYGNQSAVDIASAVPRSTLYPEGIQPATQRAKNDLEQKKQESKQRKEKQDSARDKRAAARGDRDQLSFSDAADVVFCLWMNSLWGRSGEDARSKAKAERTRREQEELRVTSERVDKWRSEVVDSAD